MVGVSRFTKCLVSCLLFIKISLINSLNVVEHSIDGTSKDPGLTDKQLAIQRWFAALTYFKQDLSNWDGWGDAIDDVNCDGNTCIRYEIAGLAYGIAVLASMTPAYTQLTEVMMYRTIQRMTQQIVYQYIEVFPDFQDQPSYPDPVAYKNIMYSGHLAQMILLFENIFQNNTFSTNGWDFVWNNASTGESTSIHYNTRMLMDAIYKESLVYGIGGVPCEPDSIFVICNNYPQNAWLLHDQLYSTNYSVDAITSWHQSVQRHGVNHVLDKALENFFKLDYLIKPLGIWEPIGSIGSDMWALSWMKPWWPSEDFKVLKNAFQWIYNSSRWHHDDCDDVNLCPQAYLSPGKGGQKIFPFDDFISTSFYNMIEKQFMTQRKNSDMPSKSNDVMKYFEARYSRYYDSDGDGVVDSYQYNSNAPNCDQSNIGIRSSECLTGSYSIWATANLLIGMMLPGDNVNYLSDLFHTKGFTSVDAVKLRDVEYPHVMVSYAQIQTVLNRHNLTTILRPGDNPPLNRNHHVTIGEMDCLSAKRIELSINGIQSDQFIIQPQSGKATSTNCNIYVNLPGWTDDSLNESIKLQVLF